jgi:hypothetical protein
MRYRTLVVSLTLVGLVAAARGREAEAQRPNPAARPWAQRRASAEFEMLAGTDPSFRAAHLEARRAQGVPAWIRARDRREYLQLGGFALSMSSFASMAIGVATGHPEAGGGAAAVQFWGGVGLMGYAGNRLAAVKDRLTAAEDAAVKATLHATWPTLTEGQRQIFREAAWHPAEPGSPSAETP